MQKTSNVIEALDAKKSFQQHSLDRCVIIRDYHADNGIFKANDWQQACKDESQKLIFAGVNAYFTNGLAEKRIRDLQYLSSYNHSPNGGKSSYPTYGHIL